MCMLHSPVCHNLSCTQWGEDLHSEHERYLVNHHGELPLFVTDFPAAMRPFYAKINDSNIESSRQTVSPWVWFMSLF